MRSRTGLQTMNADIVFLQGSQDRNDRLVAAELFDPDHTQRNYLATDAHIRIRSTAATRSTIYGHHGNAILSRHPILMSEKISISPITASSSAACCTRWRTSTAWRRT